MGIGRVFPATLVQDTSSDSPNEVFSTQATQALVADALTGAISFRGTYNASLGVYPSTGGSGTSGAVRAGDNWVISTAGTIGGATYSVNDTLLALVNSPGQTSANWYNAGQQISIAQCTDACISAPANNQLLTYNGAVNVWENMDITTPLTTAVTGGADSILYDPLTASRALTSNVVGSVSVSPTTAIELSYLSGVTSNIQTQLAGKGPAITGGASSIATTNLSTNLALVSNTSGKVAVSNVTSTELGYLSGVTGAIQTQFSGKQATVTGGASTVVTSNLTASRAVVSDSSGKIAAATVTATELGRLSGVTGQIQTQIDAKQPTLTGSAASVATITLSPSQAVTTDSAGGFTVSGTTSTELGYLSGVTGLIQTQLNNRALTVTGSAKSVCYVQLPANLTLVTDSTGNISASSITATELGYLTQSTSNIQGQLNLKQSILWNSSSNVLIPSSESNLKITRTDSTDSCIEMGNTVSNVNTYIDFADPSYPDYGLRIMRGQSSAGVPQPTVIYHRGTADFTISAQDNALMRFSTNGALRFSIDGTTGYGSFSYGLSSVNLVLSSSTTATAAGTTTLTSSSTQLQRFTGSSTQTLVLPAATTLLNGRTFKVINESTGAVTVKTNASASTLAVQGTGDYEYTLTDNTTAAGTWHVSRINAAMIGAGTVTDTAFGYVANLTSDAQAQITARQLVITGAATSITTANLTSSKALVSDASGKVAASSVTATALGYIQTVTSDVQAQLDFKAEDPAYYDWFYAQAGGSGGTTVSGLTAGMTTTGTATGINMASTSLYTRTRKVGYQSAATAGSNALIASPYVYYPLQQWEMTCEFSIYSRDSATTVGFCGMQAGGLSNAALSSQLNMFGVGFSYGDTNLSFIHAGSAAATVTALGASYPVDNTLYRLIISCSNQTIKMTLTNIAASTLTVASYTSATSNMPSSTTLLRGALQGIISSTIACTIAINRLYIWVSDSQ